MKHEVQADRFLQMGEYCSEKSIVIASCHSW
jgi:hypothetical protein